MIGDFRKSERGSGIVEIAVCMPILAAILFGVMMASMLLFSYHFLSEAAREGSRWAMVRGSSCTSFGSACPAAASDIQNYVQGLGYPSIKSSSVTITQTTNFVWPDGNNNPGSRVQVKVTYPFTLAIPFVGSRTLSMSSTSTMIISQ